MSVAASTTTAPLLPEGDVRVPANVTGMSVCCAFLFSQMVRRGGEDNLDMSTHLDNRHLL